MPRRCAALHSGDDPVTLSSKVPLVFAEATEEVREEDGTCELDDLLGFDDDGGLLNPQVDGGIAANDESRSFKP